MRPVSIILSLTLAASWAIAGCTDSPSPRGAAESSPSIVTPSPASSPSSKPTGATPTPRELPGVPVAFRAADGTRLEGRLFGHGEIGVVLSHMGRPGDDQSDWFRLARTVSGHGYTVLTYNRRGVCPGGALGCSTGVDDLSLAWKDVEGAFRYLRGRGIHRIFLGGASIGAMATLDTATRHNIRPVAVIWVAGILFGSGYDFTSATPCQVGVPVLYSSADEDSYGADFDTRQLYQWSVKTGADAELQMIQSAQHGTDMLRDDASRQTLVSAIVRFLDDNSHRSASPTC